MTNKRRDAANNSLNNFWESLVSLFYLCAICTFLVLIYFGAPYSLYIAASGVAFLLLDALTKRSAKKFLEDRSKLRLNFYVFYKSCTQSLKVFFIALLPVAIIQASLALLPNLTVNQKVNTAIQAIELRLARFSEFISGPEIGTILGIVFAVLLSVTFISCFIETRLSKSAKNMGKILFVIQLLTIVTGMSFFGEVSSKQVAERWKADRIADTERRINELERESVKMLAMLQAQESQIWHTEFARVLIAASVAVPSLQAMPEAVKATIIKTLGNSKSAIFEVSDSAEGLQSPPNILGGDLKTTSLDEIVETYEVVDDQLVKITSRNRALKQSLTESLAATTSIILPDVPDEILRNITDAAIDGLAATNVNLISSESKELSNRIKVYSFSKDVAGIEEAGGDALSKLPIDQAILQAVEISPEEIKDAIITERTKSRKLGSKTSNLSNFFSRVARYF